LNILRKVFILITIAFLAGLAEASKVGPKLQIVEDIDDQYDPAVAYSSNHNAFIAVWPTEDQDSSQWTTSARAVNADGTLLPIFNIDTVASAGFISVAVAYSPVQDEYLVAWNLNEASNELWARQIAWNGPGANSKFLVTSDEPPSTDPPVVVYNSHDDEFVVIYQVSSGDRDFKGVRIAAATGVKSLPQVVVDGDGWLNKHAVAYDAVNNRYLIAYMGEDSTDYLILMRTISADLSQVSAPTEIWRSPSSAGTDALDLAVGPDGALVTWESLETSPSSIYARRTTLDGAPLGAATGFLVLGGVGNLHKTSPTTCYDDSGQFLVVWESWDDSISEGNIQGRYVSAHADRPLGLRFGIDTRTGTQEYQDVACSGSGNALTVFCDGPVSPGIDDIIGRMVTSRVFADDFESGNFTEWSSVVGGPP
jgi:hypothetical protein